MDSSSFSLEYFKAAFTSENCGAYIVFKIASFNFFIGEGRLSATLARDGPCKARLGFLVDGTGRLKSS